ncbi:glycosyltransferase family 4 protein [Streptomyces sp. NPDC017941]|uniref:glycosyltransferase family 4 protein n=1 Tax=Streptomyces sp. NPDC017941 TaxID=3365018 RepID=UPI0037BB9E18
MTSPARVATYLHDDPLPAPGAPAGRSVYGARVAVDAFWPALLRHGAPGRYYVFHDRATAARSRLRAAHDRPGNERDRPGTELTVAEFPALVRDFAGHPFRIWHDADGDLATAVKLRARYAARRYPITATPHVLSYPELAHEWALRLLLADTVPCDAVICTSESARRSAHNLLEAVAANLRTHHGADLGFRGRLDVIPLGVDTEALRPGGREAARAALGVPPDAFVLLWLGRFAFDDKADLLPLVTTFRQLVADHPERELLLLLAGGGPPRWGRTLRDWAARLGVADRVRIVEPVRPADRRTFYAAADLFVSPVDNVQETFGITVVEAMACGLPHVVSDWDGYRDTVVHGRTGLLVPTYWSPTGDEAYARQGLYDSGDLPEHFLLAQSTVVDPQALRAALHTLISDDDLRARMGDASRRRALTHYSWPRVIGAHERLWAELEAVADRLPWAGPRRTDHTMIDHKAVFAHCPTRTLDGTTEVTVTSYGAAAASGAFPVPAYVTAIGVLRLELLRTALSVAVRQGPLALDELTDVVGERTGEPAARITDHLFWLLKQAMLRPRDG